MLLTNQMKTSSNLERESDWERLLNEVIGEVESAEVTIAFAGNASRYDERKSTGSYYTPEDVADQFWLQFFRFHDVKCVDSFRALVSKFHFVEPSAGAGIFVFTFFRQALKYGLSIEEVSKIRLTIVDVNFTALKFIRQKLVDSEMFIGHRFCNIDLVQKDFLDWASNANSEHVAFFGNPPFVSNERGARWRNIFADFVESMLTFQSSSKSLSLILPVSICFSRDYLGLRKMIEKSGLGVSAASYDNIPDCLFKAGKPESRNSNGANSQRCTILHLGSARPLLREASSLKRWPKRSRLEVLGTLPTYFDYSDYAFDAQIPRPSTDWILGYLRDNADGVTVRSFLSRHAKAEFSIGSVARNFIGIREPLSNSASSILIKAETELSRMVLLQVLGSRMFFEYWRSLGDGFHITNDLIERFPISERLLESCVSNVSVAKKLWNKRADVVKTKLNSGKLISTYDFTGHFDYLEA